jgi:hypothetical protein
MATDPDAAESQARAALNYVGADPEAATVWARAINDADLSADTRQQLIEDLDVAGLPADPRRLTQEHLPLILGRLAIVEQLAPAALDDTNAAAFTAVHRRLANLAAGIERASTSTPAPAATPGPQPEVDPQQPQS